MRRSLALLVLLSMAFSIGCGDDKSPTGNGAPTYDGTITATIAGDLQLDFNCTTAYGLAVAGDTGQGTAGTMQIQGKVTEGADEYMIDIQVYHDPATGSFTLEFPPDDGVASVAKNNVGNFSDSGSIAFTEVSESRLVGTFSFHAFRVVGVGQTASIDVTDGSFDVPVIDLEK